MDRKLFFTLMVSFLLMALLYGLFQIFAPFISSLLWASVLVLLTYPLYNWTLKRMPNKPELASLLVCIGLVLTLLLPATLLSLVLFKQLNEGANLLSQSLQQTDYKAILKLEHPFFQQPWVQQGMGYLDKYVDWDTIDLRAMGVNAMKNLSSFVMTHTQSFFAAFSSFFFVLVMVGINMFFLFRDGPQFVNFLKNIIPLEPAIKDNVLARMNEVIKASMYGNVGTALAQGLIGGAAFIFLGIPSAVLWMVLMMVMGFLPLAGPFVVWIPAAIWLFIKGSWIKAVILTLWGVLVVGSIDNVLRPILIQKVSSKENQLNTLVLFLGVLGGIRLFGFLGIVLAPLLIVLVLTVLELILAALGYPPVKDLSEEDGEQDAPPLDTASGTAAG